MNMIKTFFTLLLIVAPSQFSHAEAFANWRFEVPEESASELVEENNGLYLQFKGTVSMRVDFAVLGGNSTALYLIPSKKQGELLPRSMVDKNSYPEAIQLVYSEEVVEGILSKLTIENEKGYTVVGTATVHLEDFNIGGDCGTPSYFSFKHKIEDIELNEKMRSAPNTHY